MSEPSADRKPALGPEDEPLSCGLNDLNLLVERLGIRSSYSSSRLKERLK
jgi:hypothetical protein